MDILAARMQLAGFPSGFNQNVKLSDIFRKGNAGQLPV